MKILLDANVLLAAEVAQGLCHLVVESCLAEHDLVSSDELLQELETKLHVKLKVPALQAKTASSFFRGHSRTVKPVHVAKNECRDPNDAHILGAALAGDCDIIVTGDKDLLVLGGFRGIPILSPRAFWDRHRKK